MFFWKEKQNFYIIPAGITSSKSTIEALEQGMKYIQSQEERPLGNIIDVILFYTLSYCFVVHFEHAMPARIVKIFFIGVK